MNNKISEILNAFPAGVWVDASKYRRFMGLGFVQNADGGEALTIQLRKATDSGGTGATNLGTATVVTQAGSSPADNQLLTGAADAQQAELGEDGSGNAYTHVSVSVTTDASPETAEGSLIVGDGRYFEDTLAGEGKNVTYTNP